MCIVSDVFGLMCCEYVFCLLCYNIFTLHNSISEQELTTFKVLQLLYQIF